MAGGAYSINTLLAAEFISKNSREDFSGVLEESPTLQEAALARTREQLWPVRLPAGFLGTVSAIVVFCWGGVSRLFVKRPFSTCYLVGEICCLVRGGSLYQLP